MKGLRASEVLHRQTDIRNRKGQSRRPGIELRAPPLQQGESLSSKDLAADAFDEHAEIDAILQEIAGLPVDKEEWLGRITELKQVVQEHVRKEEGRMFPAARILLDEARTEDLGRQIQKMRQQRGPGRNAEN